MILFNLTKEETQHLIDHLNANKIDDPDTVGGWYCGNRRAFIKRHRGLRNKLVGLCGKETM